MFRHGEDRTRQQHDSAELKVDRPQVRHQLAGASWLEVILFAFPSGACQGAVDEVSILQLQDEVVGRDEALVVRDDHQGALPQALVLPEEVEDLVAGLRVELTGWLVGQDEHRVLDQRPRDRHALLLAPRQLVRAVVEAGSQADLGDQIDGLLPPGRRAPQGQEWDQDVVDGGEVLDQVEGREDEADLV